MATERILITVKTYPTLSKKYIELVCTAGFREDGSWVRIYPVPFRTMDEMTRYQKWEWIETSLTKRSEDRRPESYRPDMGDFRCTNDSISATHHWGKRMQMIERGGIYENMNALIAENKKSDKSLATFYPKEVLDFRWEKTDIEWDANTLEEIQNKLAQPDFFNPYPNNFKVVKKLPYKFIYTFKDDRNTIHELAVIDWEVGAAYWKWLPQYETEEKTLEKIKQKFLDVDPKKDLFFFMGTTLQFDQWAKNPFMIIGVILPPKNLQYELF